MDKLVIVTDNEVIDRLYVLILWPEVQELMEYDWFNEECVLYQAFEGQTELSSAYFVPYSRVCETNKAV